MPAKILLSLLALSIASFGFAQDPKPKDTKSTEAPKTKGVADRIRAAAERLRGKKDDADEKAGRQASTKGRTAKRTTPQKSG